MIDNDTRTGTPVTLTEPRRGDVVRATETEHGPDGVTRTLSAQVLLLSFGRHRAWAEGIDVLNGHLVRINAGCAMTYVRTATEAETDAATGRFVGRFGAPLLAY